MMFRPKGCLRFLFSLITLAAAAAVCSLYAQNIPFGLRKTGNIPVIPFNSNDTLQNAWCGGFNAPQFYETDFNQDGFKDLIVFDRSGNKLLTFEYNSFNSKYAYKPEWEAFFPACFNWIIIQDYNGDGSPDLFTSAGNGIKVFRNLAQSGELPQFELVTDLLLSDYGNGPFNLYVSPVDLPAIHDMDGDGDLDVVTFYILGTCVEYHKNLSVELYGTTDSLKFALDNSNWGHFTESSTDNSVNLNDSCGRLGEARHSGSSLLMHDFDHDNDPDLFLGDVSYPELLVLVNQPENGRDIIIEYPFNYPDYSALKIDLFPAGFILQPDTNQDPMLVIAPNTDNQSINYGRVAKAFPTGNPNFDFTGTETPFLTHEAIDFGTSAYPCLIDLDTDGDLDLIAGTYGRFTPSGIPLVDGDYTASLSYLRNDGTNQLPVFRQVDNDLGSLLAGNFFHLAPAAGNLNGDEFPDLVVGTYNSGLLYLRQAPATGLFQLMDTLELENVPTFPVPALQDMNNDGKPDLVLGGRPGRFQYYINTSSGDNVQFEATPIIFEGLETIQEGVSNYGYSSPTFINYNDTLRMFSGSESGRLFCWNVFPSSLSVETQLVDSNYTFVNDGSRTAVALGNLGTGQFPMLIQGNKRGGLNLYQGEEALSIPKSVQKQTFRLFPNPANEFCILEFSAEGLTKHVTLIDLAGRQILQLETNSETATLPVGTLKQGLYLINCRFSNGETQTLKLIRK
ncbi:MAG: T9SS type A sorting domain-containing protein [Bacteroidia bacterium]